MCASSISCFDRRSRKSTSASCWTSFHVRPENGRPMGKTHASRHLGPWRLSTRSLALLTRPICTQCSGRTRKSNVTRELPRASCRAGQISEANGSTIHTGYRTYSRMTPKVFLQLRAKARSMREVQSEEPLRRRCCASVKGCRSAPLGHFTSPNFLI
jgi:hypothetical protein